MNDFMKKLNEVMVGNVVLSVEYVDCPEDGTSVGEGYKFLMDTGVVVYMYTDYEDHCIVVQYMEVC